MHHTACDERRAAYCAQRQHAVPVHARIPAERPSALRDPLSGVERHTSIASRSDGSRTKATLQSRRAVRCPCHAASCLNEHSPVSGGPPSPSFVGMLVCLLVRSTDQQEDRHQEVHRLAVPHARVALCVPEYCECSVSTPSGPYPHESRSRTSTSDTAGYCGVLTRRGPTGASSTLARTRRARASGTCGGGRARSPRCAEGLCRMLQRGASTTAPALPAVPSRRQVCAGRDPARCSHQACKPAGRRGTEPCGQLGLLELSCCVERHRV